MVINSSLTNNVIIFPWEKLIINPCYIINNQSKVIEKGDFLYYDINKSAKDSLFVDSCNSYYKVFGFWQQCMYNVIPFKLRMIIVSADEYIFCLQDIFEIDLNYLKESRIDFLQYFSKYLSVYAQLSSNIIQTVREVGHAIEYKTDYIFYTIYEIRLLASYKELVGKINNRNWVCYDSITQNYMCYNCCSQSQSKTEAEIDCREVLKSVISLRNNLYISSKSYDVNRPLAEQFIEKGVFIWGLIGNSFIKEYSLAPCMWKALFKKLKLPISYLVINTDNEEKLDYEYNAMISNLGTIGFNVAMPWKEWAFNRCKYIEKEILTSKTVNTIYRSRGKILGENTDGKGLVLVINNYACLEGKNILILGAGGVVQTLPSLFAKEKVKIIYVYDINKDKSEILVAKEKKKYCEEGNKIEVIDFDAISIIIPQIDILINATPCGMHGKENECALNDFQLSLLKSEAICVETVYNPFKTKLLFEIEKKGRCIVPGIDLLVYQAALSFELFTMEHLSDELLDYMKMAAIEGLRD